MATISHQPLEEIIMATISHQSLEEIIMATILYTTLEAIQTGVHIPAASRKKNQDPFLPGLFCVFSNLNQSNRCELLMF